MFVDITRWKGAGGDIFASFGRHANHGDDQPNGNDGRIPPRADLSCHQRFLSVRQRMSSPDMSLPRRPSPTTTPTALDLQPPHASRCVIWALSPDLDAPPTLIKTLHAYLCSRAEPQSKHVHHGECRAVPPLRHRNHTEPQEAREAESQAAAPSPFTAGGETAPTAATTTPLSLTRPVAPAAPSPQRVLLGATWLPHRRRCLSNAGARATGGAGPGAGGGGELIAHHWAESLLSPKGITSSSSNSGGDGGGGAAAAAAEENTSAQLHHSPRRRRRFSALYFEWIDRLAVQPTYSGRKSYAANHAQQQNGNEVDSVGGGSSGKGEGGTNDAHAARTQRCRSGFPRTLFFFPFAAVPTTTTTVTTPATTSALTVDNNTTGAGAADMGHAHDRRQQGRFTHTHIQCPHSVHPPGTFLLVYAHHIN